MLTDKSLYLLIISLIGINICMIETIGLEVTVSYLLFFYVQKLD